MPDATVQVCNYLKSYLDRTYSTALQKWSTCRRKWLSKFVVSSTQPNRTAKSPSTTFSHSCRKKHFSGKRCPMLKCTNFLDTDWFMRKSNLWSLLNRYRSSNRWKRIHLMTRQWLTSLLSVTWSKICFCLSISVTIIWSLRLKTNLFRYLTFSRGSVCTNSTFHLRNFSGIE